MNKKSPLKVKQPQNIVELRGTGRPELLAVYHGEVPMAYVCFEMVELLTRLLGRPPQAGMRLQVFELPPPKKRSS